LLIYKKIYLLSILSYPGEYYEDIEELIVKLISPGHIPSYQCRKCNKIMKRKDHIKNHVQTHFVGQEVTCVLCGKVYKNVRSLEVHRSSYHNFNSSVVYDTS